MSGTKIAVPQAELEKVAQANLKLVDAAKELYALTQADLDPEARKRLEASLSKILESSRTIGAAVLTASGRS